MSDTGQLETLLSAIATRLLENRQWLATAESCTGGGLGHALTSLSGSSGWYQGGVVSYSNSLKQKLIAVSPESLQQFGAVSEQVAREMVVGVARIDHADFAISTTGIAGPDGGTEGKPVGTVCFGFYIRGEVNTETCVFSGNRAEVREATVIYALQRLIELMEGKKNG